MAREDRPGDRRLVAYLTVPDPGRRAADLPSALRGFLRQRLPEHMVPAAFVVLAALPLTPNGKLDRKALPAPEWAGGAAPAAPRNALEEKLARIWREVLRAERVGIHDNFFELGGDSILGIQVISKLAQEGWRLTPRQLFERPTVAGLAAVAQPVAALAGGAGIEGIDAGEPLDGPVPLTPVQRWFLDQDLPAPEHFNQAVLLETAEPLDAGRLDAALGRTVAHHDALALRFAPASAPAAAAERPAWQAVAGGPERRTRPARSAWRGSTSPRCPRRGAAAPSRPPRRRCRRASTSPAARCCAPCSSPSAPAPAPTRRWPAAGGPAAPRRPSPGDRRRVVARAARGPGDRLSPARRRRGGAPARAHGAVRALGPAARRARAVAGGARRGGRLAGAGRRRAAAPPRRPARRREHRREPPRGGRRSHAGGDARPPPGGAARLPHADQRPPPRRARPGLRRLDRQPAPAGRARGARPRGALRRPRPLAHRRLVHRHLPGAARPRRQRRRGSARRRGDQGGQGAAARRPRPRPRLRPGALPGRGPERFGYGGGARRAAARRGGLQLPRAARSGGGPRAPLPPLPRVVGTVAEPAPAPAASPGDHRQRRRGAAAGGLVLQRQPPSPGDDRAPGRPLPRAARGPDRPLRGGRPRRRDAVGFPPGAARAAPARPADRRRPGPGGGRLSRLLRPGGAPLPLAGRPRVRRLHRPAQPRLQPGPGRRRLRAHLGAARRPPPGAAHRLRLRRRRARPADRPAAGRRSPGSGWTGARSPPRRSRRAGASWSPPTAAAAWISGGRRSCASPSSARRPSTASCGATITCSSTAGRCRS